MKIRPPTPPSTKKYQNSTTNSKSYNFISFSLYILIDISKSISKIYKVFRRKKIAISKFYAILSQQQQQQKKTKNHYCNKIYTFYIL